ncbi:cilia- and flagella-associated protein 144-like [Diorhabda carinulata]|uniref:cilia- and flagella-associated protein 144-like n=1 Tax=Diorhabda carinulata TaxID=1163345 RepID=UPI0025A03CA8|nr:cilia- and flagella-associated protein 144-like [Diorhabda carinulata]
MKPKDADAILKERCQFEFKFTKIYENFSPIYKTQSAVTAKFYSKYEASDEYDVNPDILNNLIRAIDYPPKTKLLWPETVNQWYGWFTQPLTDADRNDPNLYFPRMDTEITRNSLKLHDGKSKMKKK